MLFGFIREKMRNKGTVSRDLGANQQFDKRSQDNLVRWSLQENLNPIEFKFAMEKTSVVKLQKGVDILSAVGMTAEF
jgi:hypothetical protein